MPETPQECSARAAQARDLRARLREAARTLPWLQLFGTERRAMGGVCFPAAPVFVEALCQTILEHPARYPDLQDRARFLLAQHEEADGWSGLRDELECLCELAGDHALAARAESVKGAIAIVRRLERDASQEEWGGRAWGRLMGLGPATVVLDAYKESMLKRRARPPRKKEVSSEARRERGHRWEGQLMLAFRRLLQRRGEV
jgi:hypothetical protein